MKKILLNITLILTVFYATSNDRNKYFEMAKNLELFTNVYKELNASYVDEIDPNQLMTDGIVKMLEGLDPFTNYITGADIDEYQMQTTGKYGGIGSRIAKINDRIVLTEPYEGYPAYKAGLEPGDVILEIDGKSCTKYNSSEVSELLKGEPGTMITLKVQKAVSNEEKTYTFERAEIKLNNVVFAEMLNNEVGYIKLISFTDDAANEVQEAVLKFKKNPSLKGIVLDLRGNGGGLLGEAINICNTFVDKGTTIVNTKGKAPENNYEYATQSNPIDINIPIAVLIDGGSASASEIVSGSIQDLDRGVIIGNNSYGKGLVQSTKPLGYKSKLKLTISKYYIPSGRCIQRIDYSHRDESGHANTIPDSLRTSFKTKNGRTVKDGAGIEPDIKTTEAEVAPVTIALYVNNHIFDYANYYKYNNKTLRDSVQFNINDVEYNNFIEFLKGKEYKYTSKTEESIKELNKLIKDENYSDEIKHTLSDIEKKIENDKTQDLIKYKKEISELLNQEIVFRYYNEKGRIANSLNYDTDVNTAKKLLANPTQYKEILTVKK